MDGRHFLGVFYGVTGPDGDSCSRILAGERDGKEREGMGKGVVTLLSLSAVGNLRLWGQGKERACTVSIVVIILQVDPSMSNAH